MSPTYKPSSVDVTVLDNPRIINIGETNRIPAIVGLGPTQLTIVDEAVQRGTGSIDYLSVYSKNVTGVTIAQIANTPGVVSGNMNYRLVSENGSLYDHYTGYNNGIINWSQQSNPDIPATGSIYYVTYTYNVPNTQYDPEIFSDKQAVQAKHGPENTINGILTIAASLALENGAPSVMICQASGSTYSENNYKQAIDKLQKKTNIEQLIIVFPSGSVTRASQESLLTYAFSHVKNMSRNKRERGLMCGSPSPYFAIDGFDEIGDISQNNTYCYRANSLKDSDVVYVVPSRGQRIGPDGNLMELDGNLMACAVAGLQASLPKLSTPFHGFKVTGFSITNEKWTEAEMDRLGAAGCLVLESRDNIITIRDAITTDPASANTQEISVKSQERLVKRTLREGLKNVYTNKGKVIDATTTLDIEATTYSILSSLVKAGEIYGFGTQDNPMTGETKISAKQNPYEPRMIDVTCSYKPLYPLKFISVTVSVYV